MHSCGRCISNLVRDTRTFEFDDNNIFAHGDFFFGGGVEESGLKF